MTAHCTLLPSPHSDPERLREIERDRKSTVFIVGDAQHWTREQLKASVILEALKSAASFIEEEADNRAEAGSVMSDYEARELAEQIRAAIALAQPHPIKDTEQ